MRPTLILVPLILAQVLLGDAGVLLPSDKKQPDPALLTMEEMVIDIKIDNNHAKVNVRHIFASHRPVVQEGTYIFALPSSAMVSDFAVWDDATRIPGVILERKRAEELYEQIRAQAIDPGLLQMGERDADEARRGTVFSAKIVPIVPWGTKRLEIEYQQLIPIEQLEGYFAIPLRPDAYRSQTAAKLSITLELRSNHPLKSFDALARSYPLKIVERTANLVRASFEGSNVAFTEDFAVKYAVDPGRGDALEILTHRESGEPGFFEAAGLLTLPKQAPAVPGPSRTIVALFDNSLSMQWEKLERSYQALETLLRNLKPADKFNVLLFNSDVSPAFPSVESAGTQSVEKALAFVKASRLKGGTNLQAALQAGLAQAGRDSYIVLLGDGGVTQGILQNGKLAEWYTAQWKKKPEADRPRTYVFAVGDDANMPLMQMLARNAGVVEWVRSTEPIDFKLKAFLSKIGRRPVDNLQLSISPPQSVDLVYPLQDASFPGSMPSWVGQYTKPGTKVNFEMKAQSLSAKASATFPAQSAEHPQLPRQWAKARVAALLEKIEREGEDQATIDEIIRLARKYKFVTPYTSFLAAPRALLRPRLIRPGDPVLRVKTDESIVSVVALFPFGLVKPLRYLPEEDTWQTRFLAPVDMTDGTYKVRLMLRDKQGHTYREAKTFVIASKPPVVRVKLDKVRFRPGEAVRLRVSASDTTRTVTARLYGAMPVHLRWNAGMSSNTGELLIPSQLAAGKYTVTVTAEDFAHNIGSEEVSIEVAP